MTTDAVVKTGGDVNATEQADAAPVQTFAPPADVYETDDAYVLEMDMPGAEEKNIEVTTENGVLSVRAAANPVAREGITVLREEIPPRRWYRSFDLGDGIDVAGIKGKFNCGVLRLTLPKRETAKARKIAICGE
jgi:HSP20 family protein